MSGRARRAFCVRLVPAVLAAVLSAPGATAGALAASLAQRFCDRTGTMTAAEQDRLLRVAAIARQELEASGLEVALVARSGLDLSRFNVRYSHAGASLKHHPQSPWTVRQLYYACDEGQPRLFDQGLAGFLFGTEDPARGYLSMVLLPAESTPAVRRTVLDDRRVLRLVAGSYSANAHPWSVRHQNCNQWLVETLAAAWGGLDGEADLRAQAQDWLREQRYEPAAVEVGSHLLMFAGTFIPWIRYDDHPPEDRYALRLRLSLPSALEAFVRAREPRARRIELCHDGDRVVVHHGWDAIADGCLPGPGDRVVMLD